MRALACCGLVLLRDMLKLTLEPDVISYSAGISACEKGEQWQRALALLREMWEATLEPNVVDTTMLGAARAGRAVAGPGESQDRLARQPAAASAGLPPLFWYFCYFLLSFSFFGGVGLGAQRFRQPKTKLDAPNLAPASRGVSFHASHFAGSRLQKAPRGDPEDTKRAPQAHKSHQERRRRPLKESDDPSLLPI